MKRLFFMLVIAAMIIIPTFAAAEPLPPEPPPTIAPSLNLQPETPVGPDQTRWINTLMAFDEREKVDLDQSWGWRFTPENWLAVGDRIQSQVTSILFDIPASAENNYLQRLRFTGLIRVSGAPVGDSELSIRLECPQTIPVYFVWDVARQFGSGWHNVIVDIDATNAISYMHLVDQNACKLVIESRNLWGGGFSWYLIGARLEDWRSTIPPIPPAPNLALPLIKKGGSVTY